MPMVVLDLLDPPSTPAELFWHICGVCLLNLSERTATFFFQDVLKQSGILFLIFFVFTLSVLLLFNKMYTVTKPTSSVLGPALQTIHHFFKGKSLKSIQPGLNRSLQKILLQMNFKSSLVHLSHVA
jgi:hypothetical protein